MKIIGLGNALVDILIELPNDAFLTENGLPKGSMQLIDAARSEQLLSQTSSLPRSMASGGSASNTIHGLAKLGLETGYIGKTGEDYHGAFFRDNMRQTGITPMLLKGTQNTGTALTFISPDSERTFGTHLGAAVELAANEITPVHFAGFDLLYIEGYLAFNQPLLEHALILARQHGLRVSLDLASFNVVEANLAFLQRIIQDYVDILFANEEEAKAFTGAPPREALQQMSQLCDIAVVKVGGEGSWVSAGGEAAKVDATRSSLKDTTGAGDLYASGFLYGLSHNQPPHRCAMIGSIVAGKVIEVLGAKIDNPRWEIIRHDIATLVN